MDEDELLARLFAEEPPTRTAHVQLFRNSPRPADVVLRLLLPAEARAVNAAVGRLASEEEKADAWITEQLADAIVSIDGKPWPADPAARRRAILAPAFGKPVLAALYQAYRDLDADELAVQQAILDADPKNLPGATSGPPSAPGAAGATGVSPSSSSGAASGAASAASPPPPG